MEQPINDTIIEDTENFSSSKAYGIKEISMEQYRRCCIEGSKTLSLNSQAEIFINAVTILHTILFPEVLSNNNSDIKKWLDELDDKISTSEKDVATKQKEAITKERLGQNVNVYQFTRHLTNVITEKKIVLNREKMAVLAMLLKRLNYFEEGSAIGGYSG